MDTSRYRIRPLQTLDIDAALELMTQNNPSYDTPQSLAANRRFLEMATVPAGTQPTDESLREMSRELAKLAGDVLTEDEVYRTLSEKAAAGEDLRAGALTLVAEETATGQVVGVVNAGPPAKWAHHALTQLPDTMVQQMRERVVEISDIAVSARVQRQGIGAELMNSVLNLDSKEGRGWRVAMWFFHESRGFGDFHRAMAPQWPVDRPIAFLDTRRQVANFRELTGDLRACVAPLHKDLELVMDPRGTPAIRGVFDEPWPEMNDAPVFVPRGKPSKADRKRGKKARGRARG